VTKLIPWEWGIQRVYFVLHALRGCQGNKVVSLGVPVFNVCIVLHALRRCQGNKVDSLGVSALNVSIVFYTL
jgi:hypothetical protein